MTVPLCHRDLLGIDRLDLADGRIVAMRRYFDTLGLLAENDLSVVALRAARDLCRHMQWKRTW